MPSPPRAPRPFPFPFPPPSPSLPRPAAEPDPDGDARDRRLLRRAAGVLTPELLPLLSCVLALLLWPAPPLLATTAELGVVVAALYVPLPLLPLLLVSSLVAAGEDVAVLEATRPNRVRALTGSGGDLDFDAETRDFSGSGALSLPPVLALELALSCAESPSSRLELRRPLRLLRASTACGCCACCLCCCCCCCESDEPGRLLLTPSGVLSVLLCAEVPCARIPSRLDCRALRLAGVVLVPVADCCRESGERPTDLPLSPLSVWGLWVLEPPMSGPWLLAGLGLRPPPPPPPRLWVTGAAGTGRVTSKSPGEDGDAVPDPPELAADESPSSSASALVLPDSALVLSLPLPPPSPPLVRIVLALVGEMLFSPPPGAPGLSPRASSRRACCSLRRRLRGASSGSRSGSSTCAAGEEDKNCLLYTSDAADD